MKTIFKFGSIAVMVILIVLACSQPNNDTISPSNKSLRTSEEMTITDVLNKLRKPAQKIEMNVVEGKVEGEVKLEEGTTVEVNLISQSDGKPYTGKATLIAEEFFDTRSMFLAGLQTTSDGAKLISGGSISNKVVDDSGNDLYFDFTLTMPYKTKVDSKEGMDIYRGGNLQIGNFNTFNWIFSPKEKVDIGENGYRLSISNSLSLENELKNLRKNQVCSTCPPPSPPPARIIINIDKCGDGVNCQRQTTDGYGGRILGPCLPCDDATTGMRDSACPRCSKKPIKIKFNIKDFSSATLRVSFIERNLTSLVDIVRSTETGVLETRELPDGRTGTIVAVSLENGELQVATQEITTEQGMEINLDFKPSSIEELSTILEGVSR